MVSKTVYTVLHWITFITKLVVCSLNAFNKFFWSQTDSKQLAMASCAMAGISAILLGVAALLGIKLSCRNNTPPIIPVVLLGISGLSTIAEAVLLGIIGFKNNVYDGLLAATFSYEVICLILTVSLFLLIIIKPPLAEPIPSEAEKFSHKKFEPEHSHSSKRASKKSKKSLKE